MELDTIAANGAAPDALLLETLAFAERGRGVFGPLGDSGIARYGGHIYEPYRRLQGERWFREVRAMLDTPVIHGMIGAVEMLIRRAEWLMEPAKDGGTEAKETAEFVDSCRFDMRTPWEDTLAEILGFLPYGYSLHEVVMKRRLGETGRQPSAHDDGLVGWDEWSPRPQDTLSEWVFDDRDHVVAFIQQSPNLRGPVTIPLSRCLHFRAGGYRGSPEGDSLLRAAWVDWDAINKLQLIEAIGIERDLAGLPVALVPPRYLQANKGSDEERVYRAIQSIVTGVRNNDQAGVIFPLEYEDKLPTFEFKLLSTGGARQFDTGAVISRRATYMTMTLLADFLMVGHGKTGSFALSVDKTRLFTTAISAYIDVIANVINQQGIRGLLRVNAMDARLTPTLRPGPLDDADLKAFGEYFKALLPLIQILNEEDKLAILTYLFDLADIPAPTTTAAALKAAAQQEAEAEQQRFEQQLQARQGQPASDGGPAKPQPEKPKPAGEA